jgi:hypothetical protein
LLIKKIDVIYIANARQDLTVRDRFI